MSDREFTPQDVGLRATLKAVTRLLVDKVGGGKVAALETGCSEASISQYVTHDKELTIPVFAALKLEKAAGMMELTRALAEAHGMELQPTGVKGLPPAAEAMSCVVTISELNGALAAMAKRHDADKVRTPREEREWAMALMQLSVSCSNEAQAALLRAEAVGNVHPLRPGGAA